MKIGFDSGIILQVFLKSFLPENENKMHKEVPRTDIDFL